MSGDLGLKGDDASFYHRDAVLVGGDTALIKHWILAKAYAKLFS